MKLRPLTPSNEDYLEAIYNLESAGRVARVKEIAAWLGIKMPSVSEVLVSLRRRGLLKHEKGGYVQLTGKGRQIGRRVQHRHQALTAFLDEILGLSPKVAARDACLIEHNVSPSTIKRLRKFLSFIGRRGSAGWLKNFRKYCRR